MSSKKEKTEKSAFKGLTLTDITPVLKKEIAATPVAP
jgi:hypothetical protein